MEHLADAPIANILILAGVIFLAVGLFGRIGGFIGSIFGNIEAGRNSRVLAGVLGVLLILGGGWLHQSSHQSEASGPVAPVTTASNVATGSPAPSAAPTATGRPSTIAPTPLTAAPARAADRKATPSPGGDPAQPRASGPKTNAPSSAPIVRENPPTPATTPVFDDRLVGVWANLTAQLDNIKKIEFVRVGQKLEAHVWHGCPSGDCDVGRFPVTIAGTAPGFEYNNNGRHSVGTLNLYSTAVLLLAMDLSTPTGGHSHRDWVMIESTIPDKIRGGFSRYFTKPQHRAFAIAPSGYWAYRYRQQSLEQAEEHALNDCNKHGETGCRIILVDDDAKQ